MPKFVIVAEETGVFQYTIEAKNKDEAVEKFFEERASCSGQLLEVVDSSLISINDEDVE